MAELSASGFLAPGELSQIIARLKPFAISSLLDLGCGNGRLGLRVATELRSRAYVGVDRERSGSLWNGTAECLHARAIQAQFDELGTALDTRVDGAISHDALYLAENAGAALGGLAKVIPAGRPLLFTVYVGDGIFEGGVQGRSLNSWLALLESNGFEAQDILDLTESWRIWGRRFHTERLALCREIADPSTQVRRLAAISDRLLGVDGNGMLARAERYSLLAIRGPAN